jgi:cytochrome c biogenesis protein CcmG/thiol:disulfide interchange protein DsbE
VGLSEYQGTPVVLNIWASWCVACQEEAATLERAWRQQARPRGVLFLGDNQQDTTSDARAFMRRYHIDYPNLRLPTGEFANQIPETFFISAQGRPEGQVIGVISTEQLTAGIALALSGQVRGDPLQFLK